jgi:hypothetical protein|tara:strand:- start:216 stop:389 length:174 start_codon:yes stop_codon:yes gene_type:complete
VSACIGVSFFVFASCSASRASRSSFCAFFRMMDIDGSDERAKRASRRLFFGLEIARR